MFNYRLHWQHRHQQASQPAVSAGSGSGCQCQNIGLMLADFMKFWLLACTTWNMTWLWVLSKWCISVQSGDEHCQFVASTSRETTTTAKPCRQKEGRPCFRRKITLPSIDRWLWIELNFLGKVKKMKNKLEVSLSCVKCEILCENCGWINIRLSFTCRCTHTPPHIERAGCAVLWVIAGSHKKKNKSTNVRVSLAVFVTTTPQWILENPSHSFHLAGKAPHWSQWNQKWFMSVLAARTLFGNFPNPSVLRCGEAIFLRNRHKLITGSKRNAAGFAFGEIFRRIERVENFGWFFRKLTLVYYIEFIFQIM